MLTFDNMDVRTPLSPPNLWVVQWVSRLIHATRAIRYSKLDTFLTSSLIAAKGQCPIPSPNWHMTWCPAQWRNDRAFLLRWCEFSFASFRAVILPVLAWLALPSIALASFLAVGMAYCLAYMPRLAGLLVNLCESSRPWPSTANNAGYRLSIHAYSLEPGAECVVLVASKERITGRMDVFITCWWQGLICFIGIRTSSQ